MTDIVERLKAALSLRPGTADSNVNALALTVTLTRLEVEDAVEAIELLRSLAGVASPGQSFTDIKQGLKINTRGRSIKDAIGDGVALTSAEHPGDPFKGQEN